MALPKGAGPATLLTVLACSGGTLDARPGDRSGMGDIEASDADSGDAAGDPVTAGDPTAGDPAPGDPAAGGDPIPGDSGIAGDPPAGDSDPGPPPGPGRLLDFTSIDLLTLNQLDWIETEREPLGCNATRIVGDFSGGPFATLNASGVQASMAGGMHERAAIYIPSAYPNVRAAAVGRGLVRAVQRSDNVLPADSAEEALICQLVEALEIPFLFHGEYSQDWTALGYTSRNALTAATPSATMFMNPCEPVDLVFGNVPLKLAEVDMRAITLLRHVAKGAGGSLTEVALRGGSKEGAACWLAAGADPRIHVASCGGFPLQDLQAYQTYETDWDCNGVLGGEPVADFVRHWYWLNSTPAGAALLALQSVPSFEHLLYPDLFLLNGDVGMHNMHDGKNFPVGADSTFLSSFSGTWRYDRQPTGRSYPVSRGLELIYWAGRRLTAQNNTDAVWPKVTSANATVIGRAIRVRASVSPEPAGLVVRLWVNYTPTRAYNDLGQPDWLVWEMPRQTNGTYLSPQTPQVPAGNEIAWYVEAEQAITLGTHTLHRRDATPIQFLFRNPEETCGLTIDDWCP